jgi:hypothetical protein
MIPLFLDDESQQSGMVCMCVVNMITSESLETEKNTPDCSNRKSDQIYVYVHLLSLNAHRKHVYRFQSATVIQKLSDQQSLESAELQTQMAAVV